MEVEVLPPHQNGVTGKVLNTKSSTKPPRKIKPIEKDEAFLNDLEDSDTQLDEEDFDFDDDLDDD